MAIENDVAAILRDPKLNQIDFVIEQARISGDKFRLVADAIESKRIQLVVSAAGSLLSAAYSPFQNRMTIGPKATTSPVGKSGIVHESAHALVDVCKYKTVTELSDEVSAYLAEVIYLRAIGAWVSGGSAAMAIYGAADKLAKKKKLHTSKGVKLQPADYAELREAIHHHPAYSGIDPHAMTSGHGVPE